MGSGLGILLAVGAGLMVGNCMLPLNYQRRWRWENTWIIFTLVALVLMPWALAFLRVPNLLSVYRHVNSASFLIPFLFGAGWGVAQVLFGLAVIRAGMALSFAITIGLSAGLGSLVPILLRHPQALVTGRGLVFLLGQVLMATGVIVCCWAGRRREKEQKEESGGSPARSYVAGVSLAALAGLLAPMLNYALAFGDNLIIEAIRQNTLHADAPYAVWPIALAGGAVPNMLYPLWLLRRNKTWTNFFPIWPEITLGMIMGLLWMGSVAIYGMATTLLGVLGAAIGWSIYQICVIVMANVSGWIAGEWKGVSQGSKVILWSGILLLGLATVAITYGNKIQ
jgi:L-rhamnose-H+ transport protein